MLSKLLITFGVIVYAGLVPYLEINCSHVFNPSWPPHARFHEVWQLATNVFIGLLALWQAWRRTDIKTAGILNIVVMGGVLVAHSLSETYGGSIISGNVTKQIAGMEVAVFAAMLVVVLAVIAIVINYFGTKTKPENLT
jgi:hypothetical protein